MRAVSDATPAGLPVHGLLHPFRLWSAAAGWNVRPPKPQRLDEKGQEPQPFKPTIQLFTRRKLFSSAKGFLRQSRFETLPLSLRGGGLRWYGTTRYGSTTVVCTTHQALEADTSTLCWSNPLRREGAFTDSHLRTATRIASACRKGKMQ